MRDLRVMFLRKFAKLLNTAVRAVRVTSSTGISPVEDQEMMGISAIKSGCDF